MNEREMLEKVAQEYRKEGYDVVVEPSRELLPDFIADGGVDLLARKGEERIAVQVKGRHQLYDLQVPPTKVAVESGWRFDIVVYPPDASEEVPPNGNDQGTGYATTLIEEAEQLLHPGTLRAAFLLGWSAVEAAMREAAHREGLPVDGESPRFVLKTLYSNGIVSREDYLKLDRSLDWRNHLAHGLRPEDMTSADAQFLVDFVRRILKTETERSEQKLVQPTGHE